MVKATLNVRGRVQGVFFRSNTKEKANELKLCGYVKNLPTNDVEVVVQGKKEKVDELIEFILSCPGSSYVETFI